MTETGRQEIWTQEQVATLTRWQDGHGHPFTCPEGHGALVATVRGWICQYCSFMQTWAHPFMFDNPPDRRPRAVPGDLSGLCGCDGPTRRDPKCKWHGTAASLQEPGR